MINPSRRAQALPVYAVGEIAARKRELLAEGVDVIDLGAGDSDLGPPDLAVRSLQEAVANPRFSRYAFQLGLIEFREAVADFMSRRFGVTVDPMHEVLPLIGSKEGLAHLTLAVVDPGDVCIVPEPGYPAYLGGAVLAGAEVEVVPLQEDRQFLVELGDIDDARLDRARLAFLNYPNNPTGAVAPTEYLDQAIEICRRRGIVLAYDNPYSEITFDGYTAPSILERPGARDVAVEFHSVSKSFGMTGWRLAWAVGNPDVINALSKVKSYVDTGAFLAVQQAGVAVLNNAEELVEPVRSTFEARRNALVEALRVQGFSCAVPLAGMYLWMRIPEGVQSLPFARDLLDREGLAVLAGAAFGAAGEGFIRLSLIAGPGRLREAAARLGRAVKQLEAERVQV